MITPKQREIFRGVTKAASGPAVIAGAAGVFVGLLIGGIPAIIATSHNATWIAEGTRLQAELSTANSALRAAEGRERSVQAASDALASREQKVAIRESAVTATEATIKENSFTGGVQVVGRDVTAGTYRTGEITSTCYYAWKSSTEAEADIVDNNIVKEGTATATLRDGQVFESSRCGTWTKLP